MTNDSTRDARALGAGSAGARGLSARVHLDVVQQDVQRVRLGRRGVHDSACARLVGPLRVRVNAHAAGEQHHLRRDRDGQLPDDLRRSFMVVLQRFVEGEGRRPADGERAGDDARLPLVAVVRARDGDDGARRPRRETPCSR